MAAGRPRDAWASGPGRSELNTAGERRGYYSARPSQLTNTWPLVRANRRGRSLRAFGRGGASRSPASPTRWRPPTQRLRNPEVRSFGGAAGEAGRFGAGRPGAAGGLAGDRWRAAAEVQVSSRGGSEWRPEPGLGTGVAAGVLGREGRMRPGGRVDAEGVETGGLTAALSDG